MFAAVGDGIDDDAVSFSFYIYQNSLAQVYVDNHRLSTYEWNASKFIGAWIFLRASAVAQSSALAIRVSDMGLANEATIVHIVRKGILRYAIVGTWFLYSDFIQINTRTRDLFRATAEI